MTWTRRHSQLTTATTAQVWDRWTDPTTWQVDDPGVAWAQFDPAVREGATGTVKNHGTPPQRITFTRVEHERAMDFAIRLPLATLTVTHDVEPDGERTRLTHGVTIDGPLHRVYAMLVGRKLARGLPAVVRTVAAGALQGAAR
ncbi:SRPBCC family protein [Nocardioides zeae]